MNTVPQSRGPQPDDRGVEIITFGCRLNAFESEVMRQNARDAGLVNTVIVNTCAVTAEAERQARQAIRRARRANKNARLIVTGCAAQIDPRAFARLPEVDEVIGNAEKLASHSFAPAGAERVRVNDIQSVRETAGHLVSGFAGRARAFLQVQNGCDHRCTFCIIPFGRGPSRSVAVGEVVAQARDLVAAGLNEIVFTGVDIGAYGAGLAGAAGAWQARAPSPAPCAPACAPSSHVHRRGGSGRSPVRFVRRRAASDAALASQFAGRRRPYSQAYEAPS